MVEAVTGGLKVSLPAADPTPGTVAELVLADGTEQILRKSAAGTDGVTALLDASATRAETATILQRFVAGLLA